jgi:hypothetical protein
MPTRADRAFAALIAAALVAILAIAAWLEPSARGFGTHEMLYTRLGRPAQPCTWVALTGKPCPTCGMTTAFAHAADGHLIASVLAQPMGAALALVSATGFWIALHVALTGSNAAAILHPLATRRALWASIALLAASWIYKIATWPTP